MSGDQFDTRLGRAGIISRNNLDRPLFSVEANGRLVLDNAERVLFDTYSTAPRDISPNDAFGRMYTFIRLVSDGSTHQFGLKPPGYTASQPTGSTEMKRVRWSVQVYNADPAVRLTMTGAYIYFPAWIDVGHYQRFDWSPTNGRWYAVGYAGSVFQDDVVTNSDTDGTISTGAIIASQGGLSIGLNSYLGGNVSIASGSASTSTTTGALKVTGGAGVSGSVNADKVFSKNPRLILEASTGLTVSTSTATALTYNTLGLDPYTAYTNHMKYEGSAGSPSGSKITNDDSVAHYWLCSYSCLINPAGVTATNVGVMWWALNGDIFGPTYRRYACNQASLTTAFGAPWFCGTALIEVPAGQYIQLVGFQNTGGDVTFGGSSYGQKIQWNILEVA